MKQQLLAVALFTSIISSAAGAKDYSGFRLGVGAVSGQEFTFDGNTANSGNRAKIEAGYDFNRVFAINGSVTAFSGAAYSESSDGTNAGGDIRGRDVRLELRWVTHLTLPKAGISSHMLLSAVPSSMVQNVALSVEPNQHLTQS